MVLGSLASLNCANELARYKRRQLLSGCAMRRFLITAFSCVVACGMYGRADQLAKLVATHGDTTISATIDKWNARATITTHEVQIGKPSDGRPEVIQSSCTYSRYPCSVVDRLQITVNGNALFIPRSAFCDLADLNDAEIVSGTNGLILRLGGGDASEAYIVKIEFDGTRVTRRTLSSGTLPNKPLQETIYHAVQEGN